MKLFTWNITHPKHVELAIYQVQAKYLTRDFERASVWNYIESESREYNKYIFKFMKKEDKQK
ncbi:hypothetical protein AGMMS5026_01530 [Endomicrobiia bacterium]|nr:hypothetical protein AGMMS49523_06590 [Endomicrobiia bacterium]GHT11897.1 hypothetical protein AGMMS49571_02980 [Endomicrobiia bacterium]GHT19701.1 hypothetical protein AGMMS49929_04040 [Endomicrobiia bacterium]GHT26555.1 hypothetical protein AGMMS49995_03440 [Endomicrobiia bacterium]GHT29668.1 hypothetical protein AGMMS5026_01530 [Endomicrobiia bacterium]